MSNITKKIRESQEIEIRKQMFELTHSFAGTVVYCFGKLEGLENKEILEKYNALKKIGLQQQDEIKDYVSFIKETFFKDLVIDCPIYFVYDERGLFTPAIISEKYPVLGFTGITQRVGKDPYIKVEEVEF